MNSWNLYYKNHSTYIGDGIWNVKFDNGRVNYDLGLNFVKDKDEMRERLVFLSAGILTIIVIHFAKKVTKRDLHFLVQKSNHNWFKSSNFLMSLAIILSTYSLHSFSCRTEGFADTSIRKSTVSHE